MVTLTITVLCCGDVLMLWQAGGKSWATGLGHSLFFEENIVNDVKD